VVGLENSQWTHLDLNQGPHPYQRTSDEFGKPLRSNAYRRNARCRMGFGVFWWVVLGVVGFGCFGLWCADSVQVTVYRRPKPDFQDGPRLPSMRAKPTNSSDPSQSSPRVLQNTMTATPPMIIKRDATQSLRCDREAFRHFKPAIPPAPLA